MDQAETPTAEEINVDELLEGIEAPGDNSIPMGDEVAAAPPPEQEWEINYKGQIEKVPLQKFKEYAQQGRDYAQRMGEYNRNLQDFEQRTQRLRAQEEEYKVYQQVDAWAKANPEQWMRVQQGLAPKEQSLDPSNPLAPVVQSIREELAEIKGWKQQILSKEQQASYAAEDKALDETISQVKNQYKEVDFNELDERGISLENRVLKHCADKGIRDFEAGFLQFNKDRLFKLHADRAKENVGKELQKNAKAGVVSNGSRQRQTSLSQATNIKNKSYEQLTEDALQELGIRR